MQSCGNEIFNGTKILSFNEDDDHDDDVDDDGSEL